MALLGIFGGIIGGIAAIMIGNTTAAVWAFISALWAFDALCTELTK